MSNPEGDRRTFSYDVADRRTLKELANGTRASYTYDAADQILQLFNLRSDDSLISGFTYEMDAAGNRTSVLEGTGDRVTWTYDPANQLTSEHRSGAHTYFHAFVYDPAGNRLVKLEDGAATTYTYDVANQLDTSSDATGQTDFLFDVNGNQQIVVEPSGDRTTSAWDFEHQTTRMELPSGDAIAMAYNANFRRALETTSVSGPVRFVWDHESDCYLMDRNDNGTALAVYSGEPQLYGSLISQRQSATTHWMHSDAFGSTRQLTTAAESTSDLYVFDAWGRPVSTMGTAVNPFRWAGRYGFRVSLMSGMIYVRARTYDPLIARWTSPDLLIFADGLNWYRAFASAPTTSTDPSGMLSIPFDGQQPLPATVA